MLGAYLDIEPRAVWVLSDFLQEAGVAPLRAGGRDKRVQWVMTILPPPLAHHVACDQAEHVMLVHGLPSDHAWRQVVAAKRQWIDGGIDDLVLAQIPRATELGRGGGYRSWPRLGQRLVDAVLATSPEPSVVQAVPKLAASCAEDARREVDWQCVHLKTTLLQGGRVPGPE